MPRIRATASAVIDAPPAAVYAILADYRNGHPRILPEQYFSNLEVERGGVGAGTVIRFQVRTLGITRRFRGEVTEPEPGRVLVESYPETGEVTSFTVEPVDGGGRAAVTITTAWVAPGLGGLVQRVLAPPILRRIYAEELRNLAGLASEQGKRKDGERTQAFS
jgi:hypothetical protein